MKLRASGGDFIHESFAIVENLDNYCSTVEFFTSSPMGDTDFTLEDESGNKADLVLFSVTRTLEKNYVVLYPKKFYQALNTTFEPFYGQASVENLVQFVGLEMKSNYKTEEVFWNIPSCKLTTLLGILNKYASVANGGGVRFYVDLYGNLNLCDLKKAYYSRSEITVIGTLVSAVFQLDWQINFPGVIDITKYTQKGITQSTLVIEENYGKGSLRINQTDENTEGMSERLLTNEFYQKFFTSHQLGFSLSPDFLVFVGQSVLYKNNEEEFTYIVYETKRGLDPQGNQNLQITLVSCPKLSKQ